MIFFGNFSNYERFKLLLVVLNRLEEIIYLYFFYMIQKDTKGRFYIILIPVCGCNFTTYENRLHIGITLQRFKVNVLLPWQHTGFKTSSILKAFLATFGVLFSYLQMVPHIHDLTSI